MLCQDAYGADINIILASYWSRAGGSTSSAVHMYFTFSCERNSTQLIWTHIKAQSYDRELRISLPYPSSSSIFTSAPYTS
jgi:hypothetical protein